MSKTMRMPGGQESAPIKEAIAAWEALYKPIEKMTGWVCYGFDPGMSFREPGNGRTDSVQLPTAFVQALLAGVVDREANTVNEYMALERGLVNFSY